ncbi:MAG: 50S ribosomal protein L11 [Methermicoccaceae archaeon]
MAVVEVLVSGGNANPGPPLGPALGPLGVNIMDVVNKINTLTSDYNGMQVPVRIEVNEDGSFTVSVGTPPTTALLKEEAGIEKGASDVSSSVADLTLDQVLKVAKMKQDSLLSYDLKGCVKEVLGTCVSMGITVNGQDPRDIQRAIDEGEFTIEE